MVSPLWAFIGAVVVAELYKKNVTFEKKQEWEREIKSHHGEWGVLGALIGAATGHYSLAASGLGLALHDSDDSKKWFTGDKNQTF